MSVIEAVEELGVATEEGVAGEAAVGSRRQW